MRSFLYATAHQREAKVAWPLYFGFMMQCYRRIWCNRRGPSQACLGGIEHRRCVRASPCRRIFRWGSRRLKSPGISTNAHALRCPGVTLQMEFSFLPARCPHVASMSPPDALVSEHHARQHRLESDGNSGYPKQCGVQGPVEMIPNKSGDWETCDIQGCWHASLRLCNARDQSGGTAVRKGDREQSSSSRAKLGAQQE